MLMLSVLALALCSSVSAANRTTEQVNLNTNGDGLNPAISADGLYISLNPIFFNSCLLFIKI